MAVITKITTQQKTQDRFNVFMDYGKGEEFAFSVDSDVLMKFQLKKGMELDEFSLMEIHYHDDIRKAYNLAIQYLSKRMRSEKEIRDYLTQKELEEPVIVEVIHRLLEQKYINDEEYALAYARTQINTTDKGPDLIRMELKKKGLTEGLIEHALEDFTLDQQLERASRLSNKMAQKNTRDSKRVLKQKIEHHLLRKGYSYQVIQMAVSELSNGKNPDEEMEAIRHQGDKLHRKYNKLSGYEYQQKMKQSLYQKGFTIELIEKYLTEKDLEDNEV